MTQLISCRDLGTLICKTLNLDALTVASLRIVIHASDEIPKVTVYQLPFKSVNALGWPTLEPTEILKETLEFPGSLAEQLCSVLGLPPERVSALDIQLDYGSIIPEIKADIAPYADLVSFDWDGLLSNAEITVHTKHVK